MYREPFIPHPIKFINILMSNTFVVNNNYILIISCICRLAWVKRASDDRPIIYNEDLIVHKLRASIPDYTYSSTTHILKSEFTMYSHIPLKYTSNFNTCLISLNYRLFNSIMREYVRFKIDGVIGSLNCLYYPVGSMILRSKIDLYFCTVNGKIRIWSIRRRVRTKIAR